MSVEQSLPAAAGSSLHRYAFPGFAVLVAVAVGLGSFGLPSVLTAWFTEGAELPLRTQYVVWGALAGVLVPGASLALVRPAWRIAAMQQLLAFVAMAALGLGLAFEAETARYVAAFSVPIMVLLALHPDRSSVLSATHRSDPWMFVVAALAAVPTGVYAVANLRLSAATVYTDDLHGGYAHAGILALALLASLFVAARGSTGWRVPAWITTVCATMLGMAGLLYPNDASSPGRLGGAGLLAGAILLTALILSRDRRLGTYV